MLQEVVMHWSRELLTLTAGVRWRIAGLIAIGLLIVAASLASFVFAGRAIAAVFAGHAWRDLERECDDFRWVSIARMNQWVRHLRSAGILAARSPAITACRVATVACSAARKAVSTISSHPIG